MTIFTLEHDESKDWTPLRITIHDGIAENVWQYGDFPINRRVTWGRNVTGAGAA